MLAVGAVVVSVVPEATLGAVTASIVTVKELSPWATIATRSSLAVAVVIWAKDGSPIAPSVPEFPVSRGVEELPL